MEKFALERTEEVRKRLLKLDRRTLVSFFMNRNFGRKMSDLLEGVDVLNTNPREVCDSMNPSSAILESPKEDCGRTIGCESGCWRIIGGDIAIRSSDGDMLLGFKRILKFCERNKPCEYKRSWIMETYWLPTKWNPTQEQYCNIRLVFQAEMSFVLANHYSYIKTTPYETIPTEVMLPDCGACLSGQEEEDRWYMETIDLSAGSNWSSYVTNNVFCVHPSTLVYLQDQTFVESGSCFYANKTEDGGETKLTNGWDGGCWTIKNHRLIKSKDSLKLLGVVSIYEFLEYEMRYVCGQRQQRKVTWTMEEFRLNQTMKKDKLICLIKVRR